MNALNLAEIFRAVFDAKAAFNGVTCLGDTSSNTIELPALIFKATTTPLNATDTALDFTLQISLETSADAADAAATHRTLADAVQAALHGTGKADTLDEVNDDGDFIFYGWGPAPDSDSGIQASHFRSTFTIAGRADVVTV